MDARRWWTAGSSPGYVKIGAESRIPTVEIGNGESLRSMTKGGWVGSGRLIAESSVPTVETGNGESLRSMTKGGWVGSVRRGPPLVGAEGARRHHQGPPTQRDPRALRALSHQPEHRAPPPRS